MVSLVSIRQTDIFLSQDISLFLHEISLSRQISVHKSLFHFKEKNIQDGTSRIRSRSIGSSVHHFNPYTTEDLLTINGLIWIYMATTLQYNTVQYNILYLTKVA